MSNEATTPRIVAGTIINKENINEVARAVLSGATLIVASGGGGGGGGGGDLTGYTRHFQHTDWVDFVDPVQAGGDNGFNKRFHALESEFDSIAVAISSVDDAVTNLQNTGGSVIGLTIIAQMSNGVKITVPNGFQPEETKFFAFPRFFNVDTNQVVNNGVNIAFNVTAQNDGTVQIITLQGQSAIATGIALAKKGGWGF
jgi:hypothetical protein